MSDSPKAIVNTSRSKFVRTSGQSTRQENTSSTKTRSKIIRTSGKSIGQTTCQALRSTITRTSNRSILIEKKSQQIAIENCLLPLTPPLAPPLATGRCSWAAAGQPAGHIRRPRAGHQLASHSCGRGLASHRLVGHQLVACQRLAKWPAMDVRWPPTGGALAAGSPAAGWLAAGKPPTSGWPLASHQAAAGRQLVGNQPAVAVAAGHGDVRGRSEDGPRTSKATVDCIGLH